jgi:hypothetical protein
MFLFATSTFSAWERHVIDNSSFGADGVRPGDVNQDGLVDFVTGWEEGGIIRIYLHPGADSVQKPWKKITIAEVNSPEDAVFIDLNLDGFTDVVSCSEGNSKTVFVHWAPQNQLDYLNKEKWRTEAFPHLQGKQQWMYCQPYLSEKVNGVHLYIGAKNEGAQIVNLFSLDNHSTLEAWKSVPIYNAGWIMSLVHEDMDGDGAPDILLSDRKGKNRGCLWLKSPPGAEAVADGYWEQHRLGEGNRQFMFLDYGDLDMDGLKDVVVACVEQEIIWYRRLDSQGDLWETITIPFPEHTGTGKSVRIADINLDGKNDLLFSCENARDKYGIMWLEAVGDISRNQWQAYDIGGIEGIKFDLLQVFDLDLDGDLDVITCEESSNLGVIWYENPTR